MKDIKSNASTYISLQTESLIKQILTTYVFFYVRIRTYNVNVVVTLIVTY